MKSIGRAVLWAVVAIFASGFVIGAYTAHSLSTNNTPTESSYGVGR